MRLAFLGTPEAASTVLRSLTAAGHEVAIVVTRADKRRGRGSERGPSPVKATALELGLPVTTRPDEVVAAGVELGVVVAFGRLVKPPLLGAVPLVNVHFSLLPRWRGAAPVERAILAGDVETGVSLMELDEGLDTGGVYAARRVAIGPDDTAEQLRDELSRLGADLLISCLACWNGSAGLGKAQAQVGEPTYAAKIEPADLHLDWGRPALQLHRVVRVGRAWTHWRARRLLVLAAHPEPGQLPPGELDGERVGTGSGVLRLVQVQPEGRSPMAAADWARGARPRPGEVLGGTPPQPE